MKLPVAFFEPDMIKQGGDQLNPARITHYNNFVGNIFRQKL